MVDRVHELQHASIFTQRFGQFSLVDSIRYTFHREHSAIFLSGKNAF